MSKKIVKKQSDKLALFEGEEIRRVEFDGEWYYVLEDVVAVLSESTNPKEYLKKLRQRDEELSKGWGHFVHPLPIMTNGGRQNINCINTEGVLRIVQSIPSKNAEPFKLWLARVGKERIDEIEQPSKAIQRGKGYYLAKGYSENWVETRSASIDNRHKFTDTLKEHGITEGYHYAILTNELYSSSFGLDAKEYKEHKGLDKKDSLRDNMTPLELASVIFSEATSTELIEKTGAKGFVETKRAIHLAGNITKEAIEKLKKQTGKEIITHENAKALNSPEIQRELVQQSLPEKTELSDFNQKLKQGLDYNPKEKHISALSLSSIKKRREHNKSKEGLNPDEEKD